MTTSSAAAETVGVLAVDAHGMSASEVETLGDAVATAAHELFPGRVLGPAEVRELVKAAGARLPKRCKSKRCWMKIGKAAELTAVLAVRAVGNKRGVALSFKWFDVAAKQVTARHQQPIRKDVLAFVEDATLAMKKLGQKLQGEIPDAVPPPAAAVVAAPPPPPPSSPASPPPASSPPAAEPAGGGAVAASTAVAMAPAPAAAQPPAPTATTTARSAAKVWLGLGLGRSGNGAVVNRVTPGGPGASAGLQPGDVIQAWDGWVITTAKDVMGFALRTGAGRSARIQVSRGGAARSMSITPEELTEGAEPDGYQVADVGGPPPSTLPLRPSESPPRGWSPPGAKKKRK